MEGKKIFIIGGSGSLGNALITRYKKNQVVNYSRDECKHWKMELKYKNLKNIIGNINDPHTMKTALTRENPHIIIIAAALKHIDRCEFATHESLNTNVYGVKNVLDTVEANLAILTNLETVLFVSTDKACSPINVYGMCKAMSEKLMAEKSYYIDKVKFVTVRYGNVLNTRGSIIPILHSKGNNPEYKEFTLTHPDMTRFIMTLEQSCSLIEYAILYGKSGEVVIPRLQAMKIKDLFDIFSDIYGKPTVVTGLRPGEKMDEALVNESQSVCTIEKGDYYHIQPSYVKDVVNTVPYVYHSGQNILSKDELKEVLTSYGLLDYDGMSEDKYL